MIQNPITWPNNAKCACAISFDMDADSLIHIARPNDSHTRLYPISMGRYGPTVAVPRILDTYRRLGLKQSFFIPGWCLETYPQTIEAILKDGHEIGHHGWIHEDPIVTAGQQRESFEKALAAHKKICGIEPKGYRAPVYNLTQEVVSGELIELPVHWGTDDWPPFAHYDEIGYMMPVRGPSAGLAGFWEEFDAQYDAGGFFMLILHPFLTGRLARWRLVEQWLENTLNTHDVWFAPLSDICVHVKAARQDGDQTLRVENLPYYVCPQA